MIQAKDVFEAFFCKRLAKRLLLETSISFDAEKAIVVKLKGECGAQFTSKISGMLKDIGLSKTMMDDFRSRYGAGSMDFQVFLLTGPMWPAQVAAHVNLPAELLALQDQYQELYISKNKGKKLKWNSIISNCVLRCYLGAQRRELAVSLHQAAVLLLFNLSSSLTVADIIAQTGLPEEEAKKEVVALSCMKYKVLLKSPPEKTIRLSDVLAVNDQFSARSIRIIINSVQTRETVPFT
jgi:cullin-4